MPPSAALAAAVAAGIGVALGYALAREHFRRREVELSRRTRSDQHNLNPALIASTRARKAGVRANSVHIGPGGKFARVVRIVLTGGPCGGKSSVLSHLMLTATEAGYDVLVVPETATLMFNGGIQFPASDEDQVNFQAQLMRIQLANERAFTSIAERTGRPTIIVMDRGLLDGKGYMPKPEMWDDIIARHKIDDRYILGRYDAVVHLVTAADGAEKFYKYGKVSDDAGRVVFRRETPEQARELDKRMRSCWEAHPNHHVIGNEFGSFMAKTRAATDAMMSVALKLQPALDGPRPKTVENSPRHMDDMVGAPRAV